MSRKICGRLSWAAALTAAAGLAVTVGVPLGGASAAPRPAGAPVPVLAWKPCDSGFSCATARVPLNYRDPHGATIKIAVISHRATGPGRSLGWLFFNGGGPEPQVSSFATAYQVFPAAWQERYNIITFDPRGMGYSTQVRCYPTVAARDKAMGNLPDGFPVGKAQEGDYQRAYAKLDTRCARVAGPLLYHDSTADVARDMNLLREAVGGPRLNYYGASYGTLLGAIYASLFPATTGRMILDGNFNPVAWSTGNSQVPPFSRLGSGPATGAVMTAFLDLCGQTSTAACAFSAGTPAATTAKWHTLLRLARRHPVSLGGQQGTSPSPAPSPAPAALPSSGPGYYAGPEQQLAIQCADSPSPRDLAAYAAASAAGTFAPIAAWDIFGCADWPAAAAQDRYTGPWNRPTASTILVVGNTGDPWTPYRASAAMSRDLARARLLTVDGYGHTAGNNPSTCAINDMINYTLTGALPAPGTVCQQDINPFPAS